MAEPNFVLAVPPGAGAKSKRLVPPHYLDAPFNYKLAPSARKVREPADTPAKTTNVTEPAVPGNKKEASE